MIADDCLKDSLAHTMSVDDMPGCQIARVAVWPSATLWSALCGGAWVPAVLFLLSVVSGTSGISAQPLKIARQVCNLPDPQAIQGGPVRIKRAQVVMVQRAEGTVFLVDPTCSLLARLDMWPANIRTGDVVSAQGIAGLVSGAPGILHGDLQVLGHAALPDAPEVMLSSIRGGAYNVRWVSIVGIVNSVSGSSMGATSADRDRAENSGLTLVIASGADHLEVTVPRAGGSLPVDLIDSQVRLRAAVLNRLNERNMIADVRLYMPGLSELQVLERGPADPFAQPWITLHNVPSPGAGDMKHRVHVRGVVTSSWDQEHYSIMDSGEGIFLRSAEPVALKVGDMIDVAGFPAVGEYTAAVDSAVVRRLGSMTAPPPVHLTAAEAMKGLHDAEPIEVDGELMERAHSDDGVSTLLLSTGERSFFAVLPPHLPSGFLDTLQVGSRLRVRGVCVIHADDRNSPRNFSVLLRSAGDVVVLSRTAWLTPKRGLTLAGALFALVLAVVAWNRVLRRRVQAQTRLIRDQLEESRRVRTQAEEAHREKSVALNELLALQRELLAAQEELQHRATHDSLTGVWNRGAILDLLRREIERGARGHSALGLLLLDLDHFKSVNDMHGHLVGDAVLRQVGSRLMANSRPYDIVGRYGGEEFVVLLPGCGSEETWNGAERVRNAIASIPFQTPDGALSITVSIGATVVRGGSETSDTAVLNNADEALYQAKSSGRNITIFYDVEGVRSEAEQRSQAALS